MASPQSCRISTRTWCSAFRYACRLSCDLLQTAISLLETICEQEHLDLPQSWVFCDKDRFCQEKILHRGYFEIGAVPQYGEHLSLSPIR
jgi:hypothetical protein